MLKQNIFVINGFEHPHIGYTNGNDWNGFETPCFEIDEALSIMAEYNIDRPECPMTYNQTTDTFYVAETEYTSECVWKGFDCRTTEGIKHCYDIGAYYWTWDSISQSSIEAIAEQIEDFLWEFDPYEHRDNYNDREELLEEIISQLKNFSTLKQVLIIFYDFSLTDEELFEKLRKELKI